MMIFGLSLAYPKYLRYKHYMTHPLPSDVKPVSVYLRTWCQTETDPLRAAEVTAVTVGISSEARLGGDMVFVTFKHKDAPLAELGLSVKEFWTFFETLLPVADALSFMQNNINNNSEDLQVDKK